MLQSDKYLLNENVLMTILIIVNTIFIDLKHHWRYRQKLQINYR